MAPTSSRPSSSREYNLRQPRVNIFGQIPQPLLRDLAIHPRAVFLMSTTFPSCQVMHNSSHPTTPPYNISRNLDDCGCV